MIHFIGATSEAPSKDIPGNLNADTQDDNTDKQNNNNNNNNSNSTDDDLQEDEDEKVSRKAKQKQQAVEKNRKIIHHHQNNLAHSNQNEHETSMFEKMSKASKDQQLIPGIKGLHIEDIGKDIQKIHQLLVDTAETEHDLKASKKFQESLSNKESMMMVTEKRQPKKSTKPTNRLAASSKAQVSDPSRPVYTTSNQVSHR